MSHARFSVSRIRGTRGSLASSLFIWLSKLRLSNIKGTQIEFLHSERQRYGVIWLGFVFLRLLRIIITSNNNHNLEVVVVYIFILFVAGNFRRNNNNDNTN